MIPGCALALREALIGGGLPVAEVTLRTPAAPEVIRILAERETSLSAPGPCSARPKWTRRSMLEPHSSSHPD